MIKKIEDLKLKIFKLIEDAADVAALENLRVQYLGRKGEVTNLLKTLKDISIEERKKVGPQLQTFKKEIELALDDKVGKFMEIAAAAPEIDITIPGKKISVGHYHPLSIVEKDVRRIFKAMNFSVVEGPEIESDYYNFDALNIPKSHPARDMWDTFWLQDGQKLAKGGDKLSAISHKLLLRTHTSPVQMRYMETHKPPFQIIVPGRVFRYEATDASHETNFNQIEGLMVGKDVNLANFKFVIQEFFKRLFGKNLEIRLRPSYFPFVEPGLEVDLQCVKCGGKGCNICGNSGWLEIMGAGMVHPKVFEAAHYNPRELQGFAFGMGLERIAMIKYNIPDIRMFYSGDLRFINQF
ncbi:MAG: phenylalanine--tRNA ligase subunit alpha [Candidatus Pacebacteria bacterium]|nr:phenylalanine--tRNA ligase subunit alpha [Candidatus Paceibacterota bacterium]